VGAVIETGGEAGQKWALGRPSLAGLSDPGVVWVPAAGLPRETPVINS
jgi:hypothetical protein